MDQELIKLVRGDAPPDEKQPHNWSAKVEIKVETSGEIELMTPDGQRRHQLKPLAELFGAGIGAATIDPLNEHYTPLFQAIEEGIVRHYRRDSSLTDARVALALERFGMNPEADPMGDELLKRLAVDLRLLLSLNDYSRQEVRGAIRKILKSVERHTRLAGPRGYLSFIRKQLRM